MYARYVLVKNKTEWFANIVIYRQTYELTIRYARL